MKPNRLCLRAVDFTPVTSEERASGDGRTLEGYAAVFDTPTEINSHEGRFTERIARGAFAKTITERTPVLQFDHGHDVRTGSIPIGRFESIREDEQGLFVSARLFPNDVVEPIRQAIEGGAISGMSFRFRVVRDAWHDIDGNSVRDEELGRLLWDAGERGPLARTIREVELFEAGPVVFPAYAETSVGVRSITEEDREALLDEYRRTAEADDDERADDPKKPYGDVTYADPGYQKDGKKRYPLDSEDHCKAAWSYINMPKNAAKYTPEQLAKIKGKIKAALKKYNVQMDDEKAADATTELPEGDAAQEGTSPEGENPEDAAREGTSSGHVETETNETRKESVPMNEPMTVEERVSRQSEIKSRLAEIDREFSGATLPEETQGEWNSLRKEYLEHDDAIIAATERAAELKSLAGDESNLDRPVRKSSSRSVRRPSNIYDLGEIRSQARSVDELGMLYRDNAMRAVEQARFPGSTSREAAQESVARLLDNVDDKDGTLARRILATGSPVYDRAFGKAMLTLSTNTLTSEERAALAVGAGATGGFAVPYQLDPTVILTSDGVVDPLRSISRVEQIVGKTWQGVSSAGITVSRSAEAAEVGLNEPTLVQPEVTPTRVTGFIPFSFEIDQDWSQMRAEMGRLLTDAKATEEADAFVNGVGTTVFPEGVVAGLGAGSEVETAGSLSFAAGDVYALDDALPPRWRRNAKFLANKSMYNTIRQLASTDGPEMWARFSDGTPPQLIGYQAFEASEMAAYSVASGTKLLLLGDFQQFLIVDRVGMQVELVPHLFATANNRPSGQRGLLAVWRNSSKVLVDGAFRVLKVKA
jgi:HK97 family phage major capsid protein/HK97 family phage prohead protease